MPIKSNLTFHWENLKKINYIGFCYKNGIFNLYNKHKKYNLFNSLEKGIIKGLIFPQNENFIGLFPFLELERKIVKLNDLFFFHLCL